MAIDRTILIADDDRQVRLGVAELLGGMGFRTRLAETGLEALEIVRLGGIHLAVLDQQMPGHTGLEVVTTIRDETLRIPCIVCSGDAGPDLETLALEAGALAVLRKPVQPRRLRAEVLRALELPGPPGRGGPPLG
jgi:CheY-like chemotaxis protein